MATNISMLRIGRIPHTPDPSQGNMDFDHIQGNSTAHALTHTPNVSIGGFVNSRLMASIPLSFVLEIGDYWSQSVDINQAKRIILSFNVMTNRIAGFSQSQRLEWPLINILSEITDFDLAPAFNKLDEETANFVIERDLMASVA